MIRPSLATWCAVACLWFFPAQSNAEAANGSFTLDAKIALGGYQGVVEEHLAGILNGLKAVAATEEAASGEWERIKVPLHAFAASVETDGAVWYAKPDGSYFTVEKGLTGLSLADREYFPVLLAGKNVNDRLVISKSTGERSVVVATPVVKDGKVVGAVGASISVERLANVVGGRLRLPKGAVFYALDSQGRTALHTVTDLMFQYPSDIGDESLKSAVKTILAEPEGAVRYTFRGAPRTAIFERSESLGWVFVLGVTPAQ